MIRNREESWWLQEQETRKIDDYKDDNFRTVRMKQKKKNRNMLLKPRSKPVTTNMASMITIVKFWYSKKLYYFPLFLSLSFSFCTYLGTNNEEKFSATSVFSFVLHSLISLKILLDKGTKHFFSCVVFLRFRPKIKAIQDQIIF